LIYATNIGMQGSIDHQVQFVPIRRCSRAIKLFHRPGFTLTMTIELSSDATKAAIGSIQRYFSENMDEPIGGLEAGALLSFFLKEIGPVVYNKAVADAQARLQERVAELDVEIYEDEFAYWAKQGRAGSRQ
jgi:uncharacterized protein (DUF2164 family)